MYIYGKFPKQGLKSLTSVEVCEGVSGMTIYPNDPKSRLTDYVGEKADVLLKTCSMCQVCFIIIIARS